MNSQRIRANLSMYRVFLQMGLDYIVNPGTGELHRVSEDAFWGPHNLHLAELEKFLGFWDVGKRPAWTFPDGTLVPVFILGKLITFYPLNKCRHCFPDSLV